MISREQQLIRDIFAPLTVGEPGAFALRDDAALMVEGAENGLVVTSDMLVAGVHFLADDPPDLIARKALRVNLSDLAAKGADPHGYLVSLALSTDTASEWVQGFADGLMHDQGIFGCHLMGGDTVKTPGPLSVSITAIGRVSGEQMVRRKGAAPGDLIFVTGTIGDGALGLAVRQDVAVPGNLDEGDLEHLRGRYLVPEPRVALAPAVYAHATAAMDVSDGLVGDLALLCDVSGVGAEIAIGQVPLSPPAARICRAGAEWLERALTGGDDYEILACIAPTDREDFERAADEAGIALTLIGHVIEGPGQPVFYDGDGQPRRFNHPAYSHLS